MIPTFVFGWPTGQEKGDYLALDLGGFLHFPINITNPLMAYLRDFRRHQPPSMPSDHSGKWKIRNHPV